MSSRRGSHHPGLVRLMLVVGWVLAVISIGVEHDVEAQESYARISGEGSSWAANAISAMQVNVRQFGISVDYAPSGSTAGRKNWLDGIVDFAASDIPFQFAPEDGSAPENPEPGSYAYIPVTAGGTAFMYNLKINGQPVTNLRLSGENVARIFTGAATVWNDEQIQADNPGIVLPARPIVPVVRSDGSGSTAQFTAWLVDRHRQLWNDYCARAGRSQCGFTSFYPTVQGMIAQSGDLGVAGYVSQSFAEGAIGYVNYSYALAQEFPVAKVLNAAGYYTEPTPENVAVSLLQAKINTDASDPAVYLTQDLTGVYTDPDPRNYQLSSYSYFILPTKERGQFTAEKGRTLGAFAYYAMCQAQQQSASLGYSPLPINLVTASFDQIRKIPGVEVQNINVESCNNPTFSPDGTNVLAQNAPQPQSCDRQGASQCPDGTGGLRNVPTATSNPEPPSGGGGSSGGSSGGGSGGGSSGGGSSGGGSGGGSTAGGGAQGDDPPTTAPTVTAAPGDPDADGADPASGDSDDDGTEGDVVVPNDGCDPATGVCDDAGGSDSGESADAPPIDMGESASPQAERTPSPRLAATIEARQSWGSQAAVLVLVVLLVVALVFAPPLVWRQLSRKSAP